MSNSSHFTLVVLLSLGYAVTARASQQLSISHALVQSRLLSNLSKDATENLLQYLSDIAQAPTGTPLRVVHELQFGRVAHSLLQSMQAHRPLNASNFEVWLDQLDTLLERYLHGVCPVHHGDLLFTLNQTACSALPMMRRAILANVATSWLTTLEQRIPEAAQRKLATLVRKLYRIHKDSVVQKGVMEYFHISKAGGTSWNSAAKLNGCIRARSAGSHVKGFGDECRWMDQRVYKNITGRKILWGRWGLVSRKTPHHGCRSRYDYVVSRGFSYISNEYTLQGGHDSVLDAHVCPQLVNVVTLRDPLKRMESNIRFIMLHVKAAYRRRKAEAAFTRTFCNASAAFWEKLGPPITDNYLVRSFLGAEGFHSRPGSIGPEQVTAAQHQLLQFDLVLDLDAGEEANDRVALQGLGWSAALSAAHALDSSVLQQRMQLNYSTCHPEERGMQQLRSRQEPDQRLYRFGQVLNQLDELWLDLARQLGERPQQLQCGMLFRGSNHSALATAIKRMTGRLGGAGGGGKDVRAQGGAGQQQQQERQQAGAEGEGEGAEGMDGEETEVEEDGAEADALAQAAAVTEVDAISLRRRRRRGGLR